MFERLLGGLPINRKSAEVSDDPMASPEFLKKLEELKEASENKEEETPETV